MSTESHDPPPPPSTPDANSAPVPDGAGRLGRRGLDASALGTLVLGLPWLLYSLVVVLVAVVLAIDGNVVATSAVLAGWLASGSLIFFRPAERVLARFMFGARRPMGDEQAAIDVAWQDVTTAARVDGSRYQLWVQDSDELNASAAAGHVVMVTYGALEVMPRHHLAAVLAHELGHHTGGHAWSRLLMYWYSLPGRLFTRLVILVCRITLAAFAIALSIVLRLPLLLMLVGLFLLISAAVSIVGGIGATINIYSERGVYLVPVVIAIAVLSPLLVPWFARRSELRADRAAADLGFGHALEEAFDVWIRHDAPDRTVATVRDRLFNTHPPVDVRMAKLSSYLTGRRR